MLKFIDLSGLIFNPFIINIGLNYFLCSVSAIPQLYRILESAVLIADDNVGRVYLPEFTYHDLKIFIDNLYNALLTNTDAHIDSELAVCFGLKQNDLNSNLINLSCLNSNFKENEFKETIPIKIPETTTNLELPTVVSKIITEVEDPSLHKIEVCNIIYRGVVWFSLVQELFNNFKKSL